MEQSTQSLLSRLLDDEDDFGKDGLDSSLYLPNQTDDESHPAQFTFTNPENDPSELSRAFSVPMQSNFISPFMTPESANNSFLSQFLGDHYESPNFKTSAKAFKPGKNSFSQKALPTSIPSLEESVGNLRASPRVQTLISTPPAYKKPSHNMKFSKSLKQPSFFSTKTHTVTDLCKDQQGSRRIQQFLDTASKAEVEEIFNFISNDIYELMLDLFGNYVIQKLFEFGTKEIRDVFMDVVKSRVVMLSTHTYGCRVIQKAVEFIDAKQMGILADEIKGHIVAFVEDQNGNHVIQRFIEFMPSIYSSMISEEITGHVVSFGKHAYGCRVVQKLVERREDVIHRTLNKELENNIWDLAMNQYGNYVIQHLLEKGTRVQQNMVINEMKGKFCEFSTKKYSSNVVEKCMHCCTPTQRDGFVNEICGKKDNEMLLKLMKDPYANYVIQTLVEVMDEEQRKCFIEKRVFPNINQLKKVSYSKHLLQRLNIEVDN
ncbi:pumilio domain containing protein C6G9.14, putative [Entamoeba invadens IP1]|uniref:Pumilio domain containing protein C6G9.14, putative n=1 Tax=Entamoeba invadens IP1 TaxID=370355 RepID=L7FMP4_ENTIV|nr:pumilio domain containing protein C6G9.14, putative [Entamoeba invadens IP1]ELP91602.1 pumilio domain containing protein C6G9.14, putative [Entamoeba invadens IP1]|eukprot:XP_004258373.1 pumilio domain containing protein C6G9.14, putative [Entamoeba invadens IP1]